MTHSAGFGLGNTAGFGLYDPAFEHDSCGVAFLADLHGRRSHQLLADALTALRRMDHRGARGADPDTGDGAGVQLQIPDAFFRATTDLPLPSLGSYATGLAFLPHDPDEAATARALVERFAAREGAEVLGWRQVPMDPTGVGVGARAAMPDIWQPFLTATTANGAGPASGLTLDRIAFAVRRQAEREARNAGLLLYFPSLSTATITYKGMLTPAQLGTFYPDLADSRVETALAVVHSRFSTNTFPSWPLAHPYRRIAHNGEINTIRSNRNWMAAREALLDAPELGDISRLFPICTPEMSDSASLDEVIELLHLAGRSLPHAVLMTIPEAWENNPALKPERRAFYQFHGALTEPWDGPAAVVFTDGTLIGAANDRNGLRPARWWRTDDDRIMLASEVGVLPIDPNRVVAKGRLGPGRMLVVDTATSHFQDDDAVKTELAAAAPYEEWLRSGVRPFDALPPTASAASARSAAELRREQVLHGYTDEELRIILTPMAQSGAEPLGSMGTDTPIATLSQRPRLLFDHVTQLFAQVTNPPIDAIREELVTSTATMIGPEQNLLAPGPASCRQILLPRPVLTDAELATLGNGGFTTHRIAGSYPVHAGGAGLAQRLTEIRAEVRDAVRDGAQLVVLDDHTSAASEAPIPSLLLVSAVHHDLIRARLRVKTALAVRAGDCRSVHHVATLVGFGASAVVPALACATAADLATAGQLGDVGPELAVRNLVTALSKGIVKIMSKMGISTISSYQGAQTFEALGLEPDVIAEYFPGTTARLAGTTLDRIAAAVASRHHRALTGDDRELGGEYQWRRDGELHLFNPETVYLLQHATRSEQYDVFARYTNAVEELARETTVRGQLELQQQHDGPLRTVEPVSAIVRRFATGAMSYGSLSAEAHETMAIAMNELGGRSNSGEGGEERDRLRHPTRRSAIKQVASARFGVTSEYLVSADEIQIKMAQGAKPGEGGQLPGTKVWPWIARTRHATPGVTLISPPPHHDIYSIEDLAQLIFDLRSAAPQARISVKLVAEAGVGTVAAGVAKAGADAILISGHDGGTGASPLSSIKHVGIPWELGLAETHQTLLHNELRGRVTLQVDGQLKTGRDVVIAALLGAEEFGFSTAPLIVAGCVMMRVCHLDTCPVGIATQDPELRKRYTGRPRFVKNFFRYLAEQVREQLATLGLTSLEEAIGRTDLLRGVGELGLDALLAHPPHPMPTRRGQPSIQLSALESMLSDAAAPALQHRTPVTVHSAVRNQDRAIGTRLGSEITQRFGGRGLPDDTITLRLHGSAGQSLGAFLPRGITLRLHGDANDYVGKGLSGGRLIVQPTAAAPFAAAENVIAGNTILYGATAGELYCRGRVGERFAVRNSGATAVVEGIGEHGCEYMTGGRVVVIGPIGRNFAAGMSGGVAYVHRLDPELVNHELVDIEPLSADDAADVRELLERHQHETGSAVAAALLANWPLEQTEFRAVIPREYRRALLQQAEEA